MTSIERSSQFKPEELSGERYLESLLQQAASLNLLTESDLERIQLDALSLLAQRTQRYNGGDSSSIPLEKAQDILSSIVFTLGVQLKTYPIPEDAITALKREPLPTLYEKGIKRINDLIKRTKLFHNMLLPKLLNTKNEFYRATAVDGIRGFFKLYAPDFAAHEIHITADYPVYNQTEPLLGIEFIKRYLEQLCQENLFCINFPPEQIHHLLCGYNRHYESLLFNLYEPILATSLGCVLTGLNPYRLELTTVAQESLTFLLKGKSQAAIESILVPALSQLAATLSLTPSLQAYCAQSLPLLAASIESAVQRGALHQVFLLPAYPEEYPKLTVSYGERMTDESYRKVLEAFLGANSMPEKLAIIKQQIHALADLDDLLLDAELSTDEIVIILKTLTPPEVAALLKKYTFQYEMSSTSFRECEETLCEALDIFKFTLPPNQQALLERAVEALELEGAD